MWVWIVMLPLIFSNLQDDKETPLPAQKRRKKRRKTFYNFNIKNKFSLDENVKLKYIEKLSIDLITSDGSCNE